MVESLKDMVDYAKGKGVLVKLVIGPYFPAFEPTIRNSFLSPLKAAVESATGLTVTDYSTAVAETDKFGDYQHLNKKGSIEYMGLLYRDGIFGLTPPPSRDTQMPGVNEPESRAAIMTNPEVSDTMEEMKPMMPEATLKQVGYPMPNVEPKHPIRARPKRRVSHLRESEAWESVDTFGFKQAH